MRTRQNTAQLRTIVERVASTCALAVALTGTGCAGKAYSGLISEEAAQPWASLHENWRGQTSGTMLVPTRINQGPVVEVALHECGTANATRTIVLVHGVFSDHSMWRFVAGDLCRDSRLLLVDLPGCGASRPVAPRALGPGGYSPPQMAERLAQAMEAWMDQQSGSSASAPRLTLVGHSLGGAVILRLLGEQDLRQRHAELVERIDRLVLIAPADVEIMNPPPIFRRLAELREEEVMLGELTGILRETMARAQRDGVSNAQAPLREEVDRQRRILADPARRVVMQAMLRQALPMRDDDTLDWDEAERIVAGYRNIRTPCLLVWGARDDCLPVAMGHKLAAQLPAACLEVVPTCMHSPAIERPYLCAGMIREFSSDPSALLATARARRYEEVITRSPALGQTVADSVALAVTSDSQPSGSRSASAAPMPTLAKAPARSED